jgi:hypothetical protein
MGFYNTNKKLIFNNENVFFVVEKKEDLSPINGL